eukprot:UN05808
MSNDIRFFSSFLPIFSNSSTVIDLRIVSFLDVWREHHPRTG